MRHIGTTFALLLVALLAAAGARAQTEPDSAAIAEVNRLGHLLHAYDQAAWHGTDAVMALARNEGGRYVATVRGYAVEPDGEGWRVSFGRLTPDSSAALVSYEARLDASFAPTGAESFATPVLRSGFVRDALRAQAAIAFAPPMQTPPEPFRYNSATLPGEGGLVTIYFLPAQPEIDVYYVGADVRYTVDPERGTVVDQQTLHDGLSTYDLRGDSNMTFGRREAAGAPVETDVFYAISRGDASAGPARHVVLTPDWAFGLDGTGVAGWMPRETFRQRFGVTINGQ